MSCLCPKPGFMVWWRMLVFGVYSTITAGGTDFCNSARGFRIATDEKRTQTTLDSPLPLKGMTLMIGLSRSGEGG